MWQTESRHIGLAVVISARAVMFNIYVGDYERRLGNDCPGDPWFLYPSRQFFRQIPFSMLSDILMGYWQCVFDHLDDVIQVSGEAVIPSDCLVSVVHPGA
jgi:hypothetical protein